MKLEWYKYWFLSFCTVCVLSCGEDEVPPPITEDVDLTDIAYDPIPVNINIPIYTLQVGQNIPIIPQMPIPEDNPLTEDVIQLGRHLFYDTILSADSTQSCASCHVQTSSFTDNLPVSFGIDGIPGVFSSMSLLNVGFYDSGLFWDGRSNNLEEQALLPVEDIIELHNT